MPPPLLAVALPTLLSRLRACRSASHALQCHALLLTSGHLAASPLRLSNLLLLALASVSAPAAHAHADVVFARLPEPAARDPFPWNTIVRLHASVRPRTALLYFARMRRCAVQPDAYTFPAVLKACGCAPGCRVGLLVHAEAVRRGLDADLFTVNTLISFYCRVQDCRSDRVAAVGAVTACAQLGALEQGRWLHSYLEKKKKIQPISPRLLKQMIYFEFLKEIE
ncbi:uncharacterized protein C2845_PM13G17020 [Panicum miliaceum]|uniref:Pentatricopeptide repeat-containing protein n=1 Tax=Panicum miliaceum TaxID=4540 RepID=A0A3L6RLE4_PANMI|nr:uncharacterized protein C2845_PM13G17020 [Panicum miliaceum]